jgi:hypothetical protein
VAQSHFHDVCALVGHMTPLRADPKGEFFAFVTARQLDAFRNAWLFPPKREIGVTISASMLNKRTLTHLYNSLTDYREKVKGRHQDVNAWFSMVGGIIGLDEIETLDHIHTELNLRRATPSP